MLSLGKPMHDDPYAQWDALLPREPVATPAAEEPDFECRICSIHDVVPIYRGDLGLSSGPSSPEVASTSSRSSISFSQRLLSPPPNHLLRPLPDDSQVAPSAFFPWSWASSTAGGRSDEQPPQQSRSAAASKWRRSAFTTSTSSPASSVHPELLASPNLTTRNGNTLLAPPPPRFRFTLEDDDPIAAASGIVPPGHRLNAPEEEWDTDDEMEFQLNQIASIKMPQTITDAVNGVSDAVNGGVAATGEVYQGQPVRRALSVVGLAIFLTVLLK
ncbi:hypothetical protein FRC04_011865 [Tulasnella sp. 424]|nr:hypothetical protein FRC04_011865 [Tulasnella sp. 424]